MSCIHSKSGGGHTYTSTDDGVSVQIAHMLSADIPPPVDIDLWDSDPELDVMYLRSQRFQLETSKLRQEFNRQLNVCFARRPEDLAAMRILVLRIQAIDNEMGTWLSSMPQKYRFYNAAIAGEAENGDYSTVDAFPGRIDIYPDIIVAIIWNNSRGCRLLLSSLILRSIAFIRAPADYRTTPEYAHSVRVCSGLISDIISSVPFFIGSKYSSNIYQQEVQNTYYRMSTTQSGFECGDDHSMRGSSKSLAGMLIIWSLACINSHDCTTRAQRAFVAGRFKYIVNTLGMRYAHVYASVSQTPSTWQTGCGVLRADHGIELFPISLHAYYAGLYDGGVHFVRQPGAGPDYRYKSPQITKLTKRP